MSNLFEHCRTEISSASQRYEKPEAMQINLLFAEAKYSRCSQSAISLCQSAAGGGCAGGRRRSDAALCMSGCGLPLFGCGRRANLSKLYFSRPPACGIALQKQPILISSTSRTSDWVSPARSGFTTFCHQKVAPKVSARRKRRGTAVGLRLKRYADKLAPAFSPAHPPPVLLPAFSQGGSCGALRATIKRMSPFIVCAARNHDHLVAFRFGRPAIFRRDGGCLPGQVKTHPLFRIGCAERGAILPVRVPEVVKTIYFLKKRARLFFNSQNYSIFALDFAE